MTVGLQIPIRWMAPEVLSGQPQYFYASDVWSMGVVVWQLLTRHSVLLSVFSFSNPSTSLSNPSVA